MLYVFRRRIGGITRWCFQQHQERYKSGAPAPIYKQQEWNELELHINVLEQNKRTTEDNLGLGGIARRNKLNGVWNIRTVLSGNSVGVAVFNESIESNLNISSHIAFHVVSSLNLDS